MFWEGGLLGLCPEFGEVVVLAPGARPVAGEESRVGSPPRLSIKLDGEIRELFVSGNG